MSTAALVLTLWDDIDSMRHSASTVLAAFPSPLPGFSDPAKVASLMRWALWMMNSPRVRPTSRTSFPMPNCLQALTVWRVGVCVCVQTRETDTGCLVFRLILTKYVLPLGWYIQVSEESVTPHLAHSPSFNPHECTPPNYLFCH